MRDEGFALVTMIIFLAFAFALVFGAAYVECMAKASSMGLNYQMRPIAGCTVEVKPGKWIPIENYRYVDSE